jgi:hypothetical protein
LMCRRSGWERERKAEESDEGERRREGTTGRLSVAKGRRERLGGLPPPQSLRECDLRADRRPHRRRVLHHRSPPRRVVGLLPLLLPLLSLPRTSPTAPSSHQQPSTQHPTLIQSLQLQQPTHPLLQPRLPGLPSFSPPALPPPHLLPPQTFQSVEPRSQSRTTTTNAVNATRTSARKASFSRLLPRPPLLVRHSTPCLLSQMIQL